MRDGNSENGPDIFNRDTFNPATFTSSDHVLDLLVIAEAKTIKLGEFQPTAWVFEMCETAGRARRHVSRRPRGRFLPTAEAVLQLFPGDHLGMRTGQIVYRRCSRRSKRASPGSDAMMNGMLAANPVNMPDSSWNPEKPTRPTPLTVTTSTCWAIRPVPSMVSPDEAATDKPDPVRHLYPLQPSPWHLMVPPLTCTGLNINQLFQRGSLDSSPSAM